MDTNLTRMYRPVLDNLPMMDMADMPQPLITIVLRKESAGMKSSLYRMIVFSHCEPLREHSYQSRTVRR